jgi:dTDP-glucose 4,6-dehydratase
VIGVDKLTYASNIQFLKEFENDTNFKFIKADINYLERLVDCDYVINTAAETHVDNSIMSSDAFLYNNVNGVHHLLELIKQQPIHKAPVLLHFSTDEVYGDILKGQHTEEDCLMPSNPYSASKAAADQLIFAWSRTFGIKYQIVRPANNYGVGQYVEKLIPKSIKYLSLGKLIDLHNQGTPSRTWLHATDTAQAVLHVIDQGSINEIYNVGADTECANSEVIKKILSLYFEKDCSESWRDYVVMTTRAGQDLRYSVDDSKLRNLGWKPQADFEQELLQTVTYYKNNFIW